MTTLEKVRRLEQYVAAEPAIADPVLDAALGKLIHREATRIIDLRSRLLAQCRRFEEIFGVASTEFYARYEQGELGDEMDYMEWAATIEMIRNLDGRLSLLQTESEK
ncbi:MAG: hypothetical protein KJZ93_04370 [Caldilineaceae bacterium]|nr:hypothetical protein [Caldilineaceae bacterium]